jgi:hypothetical protein
VDYVGTFAVATLCLPLLALVGLSAHARNWRDARLGPVLCVGIAAAAILIGQAAWTAVTVSPERQDRYIFYAAPVLVALLPLLPRSLSFRTAAVAGLLFTLYGALVFPGFADVTGESVAARMGLPGLLADAVGSDAVLWGTCFAVMAAAGVLATRLPVTHGRILVLGVTAVFGSAMLGVRQLDANAASTNVSARMAQPLDLVDDLAGGEPAGVIVSKGSDAWTLFTLQLWNTSIDRTYRIGIADAYGAGQLCPLLVARNGRLSLKELCAGRGLPNTMIMIEGRPALQFANGRELYAGNGIHVVRFANGEQPRLSLDRGTGGTAAADLQPPPAPPPVVDPLDRCKA